MIASGFILCFSLAALLYCVRLGCRATLAQGRSSEAAARIAEANRLEFHHIREQLEALAADDGFDRMSEGVQRDFQALSYLLRYAATIHVGRITARERALMVNFHFTRVLYRLGRRFSPRMARQSLLEMTATLEYFAAVLSARMNAFTANA